MFCLKVHLKKFLYYIRLCVILQTRVYYFQLYTQAFSRISRSLNNNGITFDSIRNNMIPSSIPIRNINDTNFFVS